MRPSAATAGWAASATENKIDSREYEIQLRRRELPDSLRERSLVDCDDLRDIRHGFLRQAGCCGRQVDVPRRPRPLQVACEGHADHRRQATAIERVSLNHDHGSTISGL